MMFISQLFSSVEGSLKDEMRLLLLWVGSLVTLQVLLFIYITSAVNQCTSLWRGI